MPHLRINVGHLLFSIVVYCTCVCGDSWRQVVVLCPPLIISCLLADFFFYIVLLQKQTTVYKTTLLQIEGNILALFAQIRIQIWSDLQNIFWWSGFDFLPLNQIRIFILCFLRKYLDLELYSFPICVILNWRIRIRMQNYRITHDTLNNVTKADIQ